MVSGGYDCPSWSLQSFQRSRGCSCSSGFPSPDLNKTGLARRRTLSLRGIVDTVAVPGVGLLVAIGFLAVLAFAAFEGTFALFLGRRLHWDAQTAAFAFAGLGFLSAIVQGGLIRRLVPRFGETRLIVVGLILAAGGFAALATTSNVSGLVGALALLGLGQGILTPSVSGLLSRITPDRRAGGRFRYAHLGTDARTHDQLLDGQLPTGQSLDRSALLGGLRY